MMMDRLQSTGLLNDESLRNELIEDPKKGWAPFWQAYGTAIRFEINKFRLSKEDSEDIQQDICERLFRDDFHLLRIWDPQRSSLKVFLSVVVRSRCIDHMRSPFYRYSQKKLENNQDDSDVSDPINLLEDSSDDPSEFVHRIQVMETIKHVLDDLVARNRLNPVDRQVIDFRFSGEKFEKISILLGITQSNAMTRFSRAKKDLIPHLTKQGIDPSDAGGRSPGKRL